MNELSEVICYVSVHNGKYFLFCFCRDYVCYLTKSLFISKRVTAGVVNQNTFCYRPMKPFALEVPGGTTQTDGQRSGFNQRQGEALPPQIFLTLKFVVCIALKIIEIVATVPPDVIFKTKRHQIRFRLGLRPRPR